MAPNSPQFEMGSWKGGQKQNFTVKEGTPGTIRCSSSHGNPPARIRWFLGKLFSICVFSLNVMKTDRYVCIITGSTELSESLYNQTNQTESDRPKTWKATSTLKTSFMKENHGRTLRCVAVHEAFGSISKDVSITLNIQCE